MLHNDKVSLTDEVFRPQAAKKTLQPVTSLTDKGE